MKSAPCALLFKHVLIRTFTCTLGNADQTQCPTEADTSAEEADFTAVDITAGDTGTEELYSGGPRSSGGDTAGGVRTTGRPGPGVGSSWR